MHNLQHDIRQLLNRRKSQLLLVAQAALSNSQFQAFRSIVLHELGRDGLEKELYTLLLQESLNRQGRKMSAKEGGAT